MRRAHGPVARLPRSRSAATTAPNNSRSDQCSPVNPPPRTGHLLRLNCAGPNPGAFPDGVRIIGQPLARHEAERRSAY